VALFQVHLDATTVDFPSVKFGPANALATDKKPGVEDVNGDGLLDMVLHFPVEATGITTDVTQACIVGKTLGQLDIVGCDAIKIVP
jgi:hypothetical protein